MSNNQFYKKYKQSDIFNIEPKREAKSPTRKNLQPTFQKTSNDIFPTEENKQQTLYKHNNKYVNKSQSDIFNKKSEYTKIKIRDTPTTHSQINEVNLNSNNKDYIVKRPKKTNYDPSPYQIMNSPFDRFYKEVYGEENNNKNINSKLNYLETESKNKNNEELTINSPHKKNVNWTNESSANVNYNISSPKLKKLNDQVSNIFNFPDKYYNSVELNRKKEEEIKKEELNKIEGERIKEKEKEMKLLTERKKEDKYEFGSVKSKWKQSNIDWKKPEISVMLMKKNDKENEKLNAFQRKQIEFNKSDNHNRYKNPNNNRNEIEIIKFNPFDNSNQLGKIKRLMDLNSPSMRESRKIKILQNASTNNFFKNNFYEKILGIDKNDININNQNKEYIVSNREGNNKNDERSLKRIFSNEGIHIYDVQVNSNNIIGESNNSEMTFKIRDNENGDIQEKYKKVFDKIAKEKNIIIKPKEKITVNRKIKPETDNIKIKDINQNGKFSKDKLSDKFYNINIQYKNNHVKREKND